MAREDQEKVRSATHALGQRLRLLLAAHAMTPAHLTEDLAGVDRATVYRILRGEWDPRLSTLIKLARALETEPHVLLGSGDADAAMALVTPTQVELLTIIQALPPAWQTAVKAGLKALAQELGQGVPGPTNSLHDHR
jgi:transcriptional regulator with XRE-family HTH domain